MKAIIHIGMPKTGSSSIQKTLVQKCPDDWVFPVQGSGNMSRELMLMFEDDPWNIPAFVREGLSREEVLERKRHVSQMMTSCLKGAAENGRGTVFSAERLFNVQAPVVTRLHEYYVDLGYEPKVLGYLRPPVSFMASAFQQNVKTDNPDLLNPLKLYPHYRRGIEKFDAVFGRDRVDLKLFDRVQLIGGDAVVDFFAELGHDLSDDAVERVNETLSLPAVALLYMQRTIGGGFVGGYKGAARENAAFINALAAIPGPKPQFARRLVDPILERFAGDLEWLKARIGKDIIDRPEHDGPEAIGGHDDLLEIARANTSAIDSLLDAQSALEQNERREAVIRKLEDLRSLCARA